MKLSDLYAGLRYIASVALESYEMDEFDRHIEIRGQSEGDLARALRYLASVTLGTREFTEFDSDMRYHDMQNLQAATHNLAGRVLVGGHMTEFRAFFPDVETPGSVTDNALELEPEPEVVEPEPDPDDEPEPDEEPDEE